MSCNVRKLSIKSHMYPRPISICRQNQTLIPFLCISIGIILLYENIKWAYVNTKKTKTYRYVWLSLASLYPICYSVDMTFLYVNDHWYALLPMQMVFNTIEIFCLYGRWNNIWYSERFILRFSTLFFNIFLEKGTWLYRNILFILTGIVPIYDFLKFGFRPSVRHKMIILLFCFFPICLGFLIRVT